MAKLTVTDWEKKKIGDLEMPENLLVPAVRKDLLQTVVRWQLACRRQGSHATKTRGLVSGGGKKPFKQKGTGNARQGSSRSPLMPGGGTAFGPQVRDYSYTLPKKLRKAGMRNALTFLMTEGRLHVINEMKSTGKTNELAKRLKHFGIEKAVLIDSEVDANFKRASANLEKFRYYSVDGINVYDLLKYDAALITPAALDRLSLRYAESAKQKASEGAHV